MANVAQKTEKQLPEGMEQVIHDFYSEIDANEANEQLWEMFDYAFLGIMKEGATPKYNLACSYKLFSSFFQKLESEYRKLESEKLR
jgi:hypothetical protein